MLDPEDVASRLPHWLRIVLVGCLVVVASGAGLFAYRYFTLPTTLTIAAGSFDGDVVRLMSGIAGRLTQAGAPIRLKIVDTGTSLEASKTFAAGNVDLAIVRADLGDLSAARTVVLVTHGVVMIIVPPGSPIEDMAGLAGKTVGVVGGEMNRRIVEVLTREYDLTRQKVRFQDLDTGRGPPGASIQAGARLARGDADLGKVPCDRARLVSGQYQEASGADRHRVRRRRSPTWRKPTKATTCRKARCAARRRFRTTT